MSALETKVAERDRALSSTWVGIASVLGMVAVFAAVVGWVTLRLREDVRSQIMSRDAHVLGIMVQDEIAKAEEEQLVFSFERLSQEDLWRVILHSASSDEVVAAQLFAVNGQALRGTSERLVMSVVPDPVIGAVAEHAPLTNYQPEVALSQVVDLGDREDALVALSNVYLPLRSTAGELLGIARFVLDGSLLRHEFGLLDRRLLMQASIATGLGSVLILGLFGLAWRRLQNAKREVQQKATRLSKANVELAMLARTSALGSVAAHLIHGLKNPLAGLREAVGPGGASVGPGDDNLEGAREAANRMQRMVEEVVALLQDSEGSESQYDLSLNEIGQELARRFQKTAESSGAAFSVEAQGEGDLDGHRANIVMLIASNLLQNAFDAVKGEVGESRVRVELTAEADQLRLTVRDNGPGIAEARRADLFSPVRSDKEGGAGIGLAISAQMARHLSGALNCLPTSGEQGAAFELLVPLEEGASGGAAQS